MGRCFVSPPEGSPQWKGNLPAMNLEGPHKAQERALGEADGISTKQIRQVSILIDNLAEDGEMSGFPL